MTTKTLTREQAMVVNAIETAIETAHRKQQERMRRAVHGYLRRHPGVIPLIQLEDWLQGRFLTAPKSEVRYAIDCAVRSAKYRGKA